MTSATETPAGCPYCGSSHTGICARVKAIDYHPDGTIKRVEFHPVQPVVTGATDIQLTPEDYRRQTFDYGRDKEFRLSGPTPPFQGSRQ